MPAKRLSIEKRAAILATLAEGTPINAVCRIFKAGKHAVLRIVEETGEALSDYMDKNFRDLPCQRVEMDEQWQYVGKHESRMAQREAERGDFWLWCAIDADTKLAFSHSVGRRDMASGNVFVADVASRVSGPVQIATDNHAPYPRMIRAAFGYEGYSHGTETKIFGEPAKPFMTPTDWYIKQRIEARKPVSRVAKSKREAVSGSPDLGSLTTSHIERMFLTVRQESTRFTRKTLGYSKDLRMHKLAVATHLGIYNLVRRHKGLDGYTPAQAAGVEQERWTLEQVVEMTDTYFRAKEDAAFEAAFAALA